MSDSDPAATPREHGARDPAATPREHRASAPQTVGCFVLTISDTKTPATDTSGALIRERHERFNERQRCLVRPVDVFEHEAAGTLPGERADKAVDSVEGLLLDAVAAQFMHSLVLFGVGRDAEQQREEHVDVAGVFAHHLRERRLQLEPDTRLRFRQP